MSDVHQIGPVTTLPRLLPGRGPELEQVIERHSSRFPVALVIPMIPAEMDQPALAHILDELCQVRYLDTLLISLNKASADDYARTLRYFERYPGRSVVLWSESEAVTSYVERMQEVGLYTGEPGKGRACWLAVGYLLAERRAEVIAFQDADVITYDREMLARLVLPIVDPTLGFDFSKGYYARVSDRLNGRVTRLLLTPLLCALGKLLGNESYISYLSSFRYALSGEFAITRDLAFRMRIPSDWGLEIVTLFEAARNLSPQRICQVELTDRYDHKHQKLSADDATAGIHRMAKDVVKHLLRTLAAAGVKLPGDLLHTLPAGYQRTAEDAVEHAYAISVMNRLEFDRHQEEVNVQTFLQALRAAVEEFLADPLGPPLVPNWAHVRSGTADAGDQLMEAVTGQPVS